MDDLRATRDEEIGEIGPSPPGCGANRAILRCRPSLGMAKAVVLRLVSNPTDEDLSVGAPVWPDFRSQRHPRESS